MEQLTFKAMGCEMLAALASRDERGARLLRQVPGWFERWEDSLSRFRQDSELSRLNRQSGRAMRVSQTLWRVVQAALRSARESAGLVVPTTLPALEAAGYDRTFAAVVEGGVVTRLAPATAVAPASTIVANRRTHSLRLTGGARLDLGGVAKGWAADTAMRRLAVHAPAMVDAGGDIAVSSPPSGLAGWPIGIADPFAPDRQVALLCLSYRGVATSGREYRRWQSDGQWQHHIIDPRTGRPAETDVLTTTVIAPTAREAEAAAKTVLILGSGPGLAWLDARPNLAGLVIREAGDLIPSQRLQQFIW